MTSLRAGRGTSLGPIRPPWFNVPAEARTRSAGEGEPLEGEETYPTPDYPLEPFDNVPSQDKATADPVDVVIVGGIPAPLTDWSSQSYPVGAANVVMAAGRNKNRQRLVLRNSGEFACRVLRNPTDIPGMAYILSAGEQLEMTHNEQVWVICEGTDETVVNVMTEYVIESGE